MRNRDHLLSLSHTNDLGESIAIPRAFSSVLTPITLPSASKVGPPELPLLIGASIWI
jgi:hypothetical protein